ncbi:MAG: hypothetical protein DRJ67_10920 [Thermoprotei archaeon]|nr:MAG: hypothetical protein DRJ67_10920 [Thermoprotei archaeon]
MATDEWPLDVLREMLNDARYRHVLESIASLYEEVKRLEGEEERLLRQIQEIVREHSPIRGTPVYKWVLNKAGKRYWYWYLHIKENGRTRSKYLGKRLPDWVIEGVSARRRVRALERRLREISRRRLELEGRLHAIFYRT